MIPAWRVRSRACAYSTSAAAAGFCASRWRGWAPTVVGADASASNIEVARLHAAESGLDIDYRATTAEALADEGEKFDVILNMEVVEHVADIDLFIGKCSEMVKPGGIMFVATINRTLKALGLAIIGAEYVLRWLPRGTHQYGKLVRPEELEAALGKARPVDHRPHRRRLQSARRPLAPLQGHGRQLHGSGGEGGSRLTKASATYAVWLCALVVMTTPAVTIAAPAQVRSA